MRGPAGMGGGSVLRVVGRAVGGAGGFKEALSSSSASAAGRAPPNPARVVRVSSGVSSGVTSPPKTSSPSFSFGGSGAAAGGWNGHQGCLVDGEDWERVDGEEDLEDIFGSVGDVNRLYFSERAVFGTAPSKEEAEDAVSMLQQIFVPVTFSQVTDDGSPPYLAEDTIDGELSTSIEMKKRSPSDDILDISEADWIEPVMDIQSSNSYQPKGRENVIDVFRLLQINPSIQRMVVSLSSDQAVWDAVMKNEIVQELKNSLAEDGVRGNEEGKSSEQPDLFTGSLKRIFDNTKTKIVELVDRIVGMLQGIFCSQEKIQGRYVFNDTVKTSFMLSVMVFIVVVVTRIRRA